MDFTTLTAQTTIAHYQLERCLGVGACGEVWQATHTDQDSAGPRTVALKFIHVDLLTDSEAERHLERLRTEISVLYSMRNHPNIPTLYEYDLTCNRPYLVMEYIDKPALSLMINSGEILCVRMEQRINLLFTVADTIHAVHQAGFLHRDIKPANIHGINRPYLLDFSVAIPQKDAEHANRRAGTRLYMAATNRAPDRTNDTYGLALVAYEVLFGQHPFFNRETLDYTLDEVWRYVDRCLKNDTWGVPSRMGAERLPRALTQANLPQLDAIFRRAFGPHEGRFVHPTRLIQDLADAILIPANEQYLDYVPDVATSLSLQFAQEDDFTLDQVDNAAPRTDHGIVKAVRQAAWQRIAAGLIATLFLIFVLWVLFSFVV